MTQLQGDRKTSLTSVEMDLYPTFVESDQVMSHAVSLMCQGGSADGQNQDQKTASYILVIDSGELVGILTERDILRLSLNNISFEEILVKDCMTRNVISLIEQDVSDPSSVRLVMKKNRIRHLPVLSQDGQIVGVITTEKLRLSIRSRDFLQLRTVSDAMTREAITALPHESMIELIQRMVSANLSCIVIVEPGLENTTQQKPIGIITERDVVQMQNMQLDLRLLKAFEMMSCPLFCISPDQSLWEIQQKMQKLRVRRLVVAEGDQLAGIITQTNIVEILDPSGMYQVVQILQSEIEALKTEREAYLQQRNTQLAKQAIEAEHRFEAIFNNTFQFTGLMTPEGLLLEANQTALDFGGLKREDVVNRFFWEAHWWTVSSQTQQDLKHAIAKAAQGEFIRYEVEVLGQNNQLMWIDFSIRSLKDDSGKVVLLIPEGRDITHSKKVEASLTFRAGFDRLMAMVSNRFIQSSAQNVIETIERAFYDVCNYVQISASYTSLYLKGWANRFEFPAQEEVEPLTFSWQPSESRTRPQFLCDSQMLPWVTQQAQSGEMIYLTKLEDLPVSARGDRQVWQDHHMQSLLAIPFCQNTLVYGYIVFISCCEHNTIGDSKLQLLKIFAETITNTLHRHQTEAKLRISRGEYQDVISRIPVGIFKLRSRPDKSLSYDFVSPRWCELNQLSASAVLSNANLAFEQIDSEDIQSLMLKIQNSDETLSELSWEGKLRVKNEVRWVHWEAYPTRLENGDVLWDGLQYDTTKRKLTEIDLRESEQRYITLAESAPIGVFRADIEGQCTYVNEEWSQMVGVPASETLGSGWVDTLHPDDKATVLEKWQDFVQHKQPKYQQEFRLLTAQGECIWVLVKAVPEVDGNGVHQGFYGGITDITDQKQAEQELRTTTDRLKEVQNIAHLGSWELDFQANSLVWSDETYNITEQDPQHFECTFDAGFAIIHPDDRDAVEQAFKLSIETHSGFDMTYRLLMADGRVKYVRGQGQTFYDEFGQPYRALGTKQDITELKEVEIALQRQRDFNQLIAEITSHFVDIDDTVIDDEINRTLGLIGDISQSQESYLFHIDYITRTFSMTHKWTASDRSLQLEAAQEIPMEAFPWSMEKLVHRNPIHFSSLEELPIEAHVDKASWEGFGVTAVLCIPMVQNSEVSGFMGFASLDGSILWDAESIRLLNVMAKTVGDAQARITSEVQRIENEERLRLALQSADQGLYDLNIQTGEAVVSPEYATMLGYDPITFHETNAKWIERLHPDDQESVSQIYRDYIDGNTSEYKVEFRQKTQSGNWKWILSLGKIVAWDANGQPLRMLGTHTDISDRKVTELQLSLRNFILARIARAEPLENILEQLVQVTEVQLRGGICSILLCTPDGTLKLGAAPNLPEAYNQAVDGIAIAEGVGSCGSSAFRQEIVIVSDIEADPLWHDFAEIALRQNLRACWSLPIISSDGTVLATFAVYYSTIHHPDQREIGVIRNIADMTKIAIESERSRYQLQQLNRDLEDKVVQRTAELQAKEEQLRDLFDNATDLIQSVAPDGKILLVNQSWLRKLEYSLDEIEKLSIFDVIHPDEHEHCQQVMQALFDGQVLKGVETCFVSKTGKLVMLEGDINCQFKDGKAIASRGIFRDITERKRSQKQIERQLAAIEAAVDGIAILKSNQFIYANSSLLTLFGYDDPSDLRGLPLQSLYDAEEQKRLEQEVFPILQKQRRWEGEATAIRKDGSQFSEALSLTLVEKDLLICVCRDNTERQLAERKIKQTMTQLEFTNQELESFSYSVSHDLRAPLRHINGFVNALRQQLELKEFLHDEKVSRYIGKIDESSAKMALLIDSLLTLSRIGRRHLSRKSVAMKPLVEDAIALIKMDYDSSHTPELIIGSLPTLNADASMLQQVFNNLIGNAFKFTRNSTNPRIEIGTTPQGAIFIQDNGVGFDMRFADKLFGAFQRLHSQADFEGTGIGLAIVQRIIHRHGGTIWVDSQLNQGTTFFFTIESDI